MSPSIWYVIAMLTGLIGAAAVAAFRANHADWIALAIALVSFVLAVGIVLTRTEHTPTALPIAGFIIGGFLLLDAVRKAVRRHQRHRGQPRLGDPPDIERIP